jgi:GNAT superfamily N-acetyltransferase
MTDFPTPEKRKSSRSAQTTRKEPSRPRTGVRKVFEHAAQKEGSHFKTRTTDAIEKPLDLALPPGPVIQVFSPRMRRIVDTFLMNHAPAIVAFRAFLQGPDGGFQGDMSGAALVYYEQEKCLAALAVLNNRTWYIHSTEKKILSKLLDIVIGKLTPLRIEGAPDVVRQAIDKIKVPGNLAPEIRDCVHLELPPKRIPRGPGGHHRFAKLSDIPRLDQYLGEFQAELGDLPPHDWPALIAENRILLGMVEGNVAAVAQRGPSTYDRMLIEGMYTFRPYRRRGLAKNLVAALAGYASGKDLTTSVIVGKENRPILALLEALQFHKTSDYLVAIYQSEEGHESSKEPET